MKVIASFAPERRPGFENVPTVYEYAKSDEDRQVLDFMFGPQVLGRPHFAPPGVPADRLAALRRAFDATMKDAEFVAETQKQKLSIDPITGTELGETITAVYGTPKDIVKRVADTLGRIGK